MKVPRNVREVREFLGLVITTEIYCRYFPNTKPLVDLTRKNAKLIGQRNESSPLIN